MAEGNGSEDRVTERMVLERARVLVIPDGVKEDELLTALKDLTGSRRGFRIDLAWLERGIFKGTGKRQTIEVYAGKAGTPDAKVGTFKAPSVTSWKGGLVMEAPPKPLVQASLLED